MFHYTQPHPITDFHYHPQALSPRDRYLAAVAQAKAAEAEYLAAEATRREEEALRQRLHEIQLGKQHPIAQLPSYPYQSATSFGYPYYPGKPSTDSEFLELRRQIEEEDLRRRVIEERVQVRRLAEEQIRLRLQAEEQERLQALAAAHKAESERKAHIKRQAEIFLNHQLEKAHPVIVQLQPYECSQPDVRRLQNACRAGFQQNGSEPRINYPFHSILEAVVRPVASVPTARAQPPQPSEIKHLRGAVSKPHQGSHNESTNIGDFFKQLFGVAQEQQVLRGEAQGPAPQPTNIEDYLEQLSVNDKSASQRETAISHKATSNSSDSEAETVKQFMELFLGGREHAVEPPKAQNSSPSSSKPTPAHFQPGAEAFSQFWNAISGQAIPQAQQQKATSSNQPAAFEVPKPNPTSIETSLKAQLETRLGNEYATEVRDTIQAILASLQDIPSAEAPPTQSASSTSPSTSSDKGKAKAVEHAVSQIASNAGATSQDVSKAFDEVRSIEASFHLLESEFVFPSQLDFVTPSNSKPPTPASSDTESIPSSITHLSYTSRNNPVRHYEQSLGALMSQLDAVESFGNDALRAVRKEVVGRVERALEELEGEVEGRWKARVAKETKSREPIAVDVKIENASPIPESTPTEAKDTTTEIVVPQTEPISPAPEPNPIEATIQSSEIAAGDVGETTVPTQETPEPTTEVEEHVPLPPTGITQADVTIQSSEETISKTSELDEPTMAPVSLDTSVATIKQHDTSPVETDEVDTFLLPASNIPSVKAKPAVRDNDVGSDWSEIEG